MKRSFPNNQPPVKRESAEYYLLIMLVSFAGSVIATRLFLELTGYPQLGGGGLHIAHVLWGGLLLFVGSLLPLIFANRWLYAVSAVLSGVGVGLFIDEVGKFITQSNDYFYPFAAPIIYAFFILTALLYLLVRRPRPGDSRANLYRVFELMGEVIDRNLDPIEEAALRARLEAVARAAADSQHQRMARLLLDFLDEEDLTEVTVEPGWVYRARQRWEAFASARLTLRSLRPLLILGIGALAAGSVLQLLALTVALFAPDMIEVWLADLLLNSSLVRGHASAVAFIILVLLEGVVGLILWYAAYSLLRGQAQRATRWGLFALVVALTTVNLLVFYFSQFAAVSWSLFHLLLLLGFVRYRRLSEPLSP